MTPRPSSFCRLAMLTLCLLAACASPSQGVKTSKEQGDSSTAVDQTQQQSGLFNFSKSTQAVGLAGGSLLTVIVLLMTLNYRVLMRMIPLVNADDRRRANEDF